MPETKSDAGQSERDLIEQWERKARQLAAEADVQSGVLAQQLRGQADAYALCASQLRAALR